MSRLQGFGLVLVGLMMCAASAPSPSLRIAAITGARAPCAEPEASTPAGEKGYYAHLGKRLDVKVLRCPVVDATAAAKALAAGELDLAVLDPVAFSPVAGSTRAILTVRPQGGLNRVPVVLGVKSTSAAKVLPDLRGKALVFGGRTPASLDLPQRALAQRGAPPSFWAREIVEVDGDAAVAALRAGRAEAMVLHAAAWQRLCRQESPKSPAPCSDLRILAKFRPQADRAVVVRRDMADETRLRLIGIHMPLHLENKVAFTWATSWAPKAAEFEPTEALALVATR